MKVSTDNGDNYTHISNAAYGNQDSGATGGEATMDSILKVENITGENTDKVKFDPSSFAAGSSLLGWEDGNNTCVSSFLIATGLYLYKLKYLSSYSSISIAVSIFFTPLITKIFVS